MSFEDRLCEWLYHRIAVRRYQADGQKIDFIDTESPTEQLAKLLHTKAVQGAEEVVKECCKEFIQCLRITHYVSNIKLGAAQYCVMGDGEYRKKMATVGAFGLDKLVASVTPSPKASRKSSNMRKIGFISASGRVECNSQHEAVLSITVLPITRLVRLPVVKTALQSAMKSYMETTSNPEGAE